MDQRIHSLDSSKPHNNISGMALHNYEYSISIKKSQLWAMWRYIFCSKPPRSHPFSRDSKISLTDGFAHKRKWHCHKKLTRLETYKDIRLDFVFRSWQCMQFCFACISMPLTCFAITLGCMQHYSHWHPARWRTNAKLFHCESYTADSPSSHLFFGDPSLFVLHLLI